MSGTISGIFFPACATVFSILLCAIYFSKKRVKLDENKAYSIMLVAILCDSVLALTLQTLGSDGINTNDIILINIINKLDFICLITYSTCFFAYNLIISVFLENTKKVKDCLLFVDMIAIFLISFMKINIINNGGYYSISGLASMATLLLCGAYIIASVIITLLNIKKVDKRKIPLLFVVILIIGIQLLFLVNPYIVVISITLTFVNYIMFFTIENPDIKMIEEIKKANDLSEKYNNEKSKFIFNMTQQVRYPLNSIEQKIEQALEMKNIDDIKEVLESIKSDEKRISTVINGTLDVSSIDTKKLKIVETEYNLSNLLKEIEIKYEKLAAEKNIEFRTNIDESIPMFLYGDIVRMKQLINSILSNSVKYTNEGFVELDVSTIKTFDICRLIISVKDSGVGLKTEEIDKLFNNNNDNINEIDESDLKLDVVKKLVNLIGGTITVQSEKNKGSEFTIVIDQKIVSNETMYGKHLDNYENMIEKKKILFVSEDKQQIEFYRKRLSQDFEIEISKNGQECLEKIRNNEIFDLIIINESMTKLSASEIMEKLKNIEGFNVKTLLLCKDLERKDVYKREGFYDLIKTDLSKKTIIKRLKEIITD